MANSLMKLTRSILHLLLAIAMAGLPACTGSPDCSREDVFCAGLVTNTAGIEDHGMNQGAWEGLRQAREDRVADHIAYIESVDARDYMKNIELFAQGGYDVVITVGPAMDEDTLQAADLYPGSVFIGLDQPQEEPRPNPSTGSGGTLLPIVFAEDQMGFWAGALAARITKTGIIGAVCETSSLDSMWRYCEGFRAGAAYMDEEVETWVIHRDDLNSELMFIDEEWGHMAAQDLVEFGADVIFAAGGGTGQGALLAAAEGGVRAIGAERDQAQVLPEAAEALVTSVYGGARSEVLKWTRFISQGNVPEGAAAGTFEYVPYSQLETRVSESLKGEMDEILLALSSGGLKTDVPARRP